MIWAIGLACAAGILVFHFLNLARFKRQVFNQFDIVRKIAQQNRVVRNLRSLLLLLNRLALVLCLALFIATCARQQEKAGSTLVIIPKLNTLDKTSLARVDSLLNRSGLANAGKSNIYTSDLSLKLLFPALTYAAEADSMVKGYRRQGFAVDSLGLGAERSIVPVRATDTSFALKSENGSMEGVTLNGRSISAEKAREGLALNQSPTAELGVGQGQYYYFTTPTVRPPVYVSPSAKGLQAAYNPSLFAPAKSEAEATVLVGPQGLTDAVSNKGIFYVPGSLGLAQKDLAQLGVSVKLIERKAVADTFDVLDKGYFAYALTHTAQADMPLLMGKTLYSVEGYSIPLLQNAKGNVLASLLPSSTGNTVVFLHTPLDKAHTNLTETELFLPLLYSLTKKVTQTGKVEYYDLCERQSLSRLAELTAAADSIRYRQGFARTYLAGSPIERILVPGIYALYKGGDSITLAVNQLRCAPSPGQAYVLREAKAESSGKAEGWLMGLLATFAVVEGLVLTNRLRRR